MYEIYTWMPHIHLASMRLYVILFISYSRELLFQFFFFLFAICYLLIFKDFKLPTSKHELDLSFWTEIFHCKQHILYFNFTHRYIILRRKWRQRKNNIIIITIKYERVCVFIFILFFLMKKMEKIKKTKSSVKQYRRHRNKSFNFQQPKHFCR